MTQTVFIAKRIPVGLCSERFEHA